MNIIDMPPFAPVLMESTRAIGYSLESAIADIIDNSIAAYAGRVDIFFSPYDSTPYVSLLDDGLGMNEKEIDDAMRYGSRSSLEIREKQDLGRFGLGLKTASLSQCRCLTVISKQNGHVVGRCWDLDKVYESGNWSLGCLDETDIEKIPHYTSKLKAMDHGTLVIWNKLDRMLEGATSPESVMNKQMDFVRNHLSLVFHRYLSGESGISKLSIYINNLQLLPKDPFLRGKSTNFQADEHFTVDGHSVDVSCFLLPHVSNMTKAEKDELGGIEGLTKNQGFYVYRNKRLLIWGTWFRLHRKDEMSKLARVRVDIPNALDHLWSLDIKKSSAIPPEVIRRNLERIIGRISEGSKRAWTFRGKREISDKGSHLWNKTHIRDGVVYNLNRDHIFLDTLCKSLGHEQKTLLENYLRLVEENLPLNQLYVDLNNDEQINLRKEKEAEEETMQQAKLILSNISDSPIRNEQIQIMLQTDPFCNYKKVVIMLNEELNNGSR